MKKMKKLGLSLSSGILAASMVLSLAACGNDTNSSENTPDSTPNTPDSTATNGAGSLADFAKFQGTKLTYWHPFSSTYIKSINDNMVVQEMEKRTGIKVDYITPPSGQESDAFNLMIASGELPDIIPDQGYKGGGLKAVQDGVYLKLNDLIPKYAPNYAAVLAQNPDFAKQAKEDDGTIWSFKMLQTDEEPSWAGPAIRKDYLDELGLQVPKTIDDWTNVLRALKDKKKLETPMLLQLKSKFGAAEAFAGTFGSSYSQFLNKNGTVVYGPIEPGFKDFLTLMNQWYKEGLIDKDFATRDDTSADAQVTSGKAGAVAVAYYGSFGPWATSGKATNPKYNLVPTTYPVLKAGDDPAKTIHVGNKNWYSKGSDIAISAQSKNVEAALRWLDYRYSAEGFMLFNYGVEGVSYNWVDGPVEQKDGPGFFPPALSERIKTQHPEFTDLLTKNPDGVDFWTAIDKYKSLYEAYLRNPLSYVMAPEVYDAMDKWSTPEKDYNMPPLSSTDEEVKVNAEVMTQINTYREEMVYKFIMGEEPIGDFDKYVAQIKKMGIDKMIKITQDQLGRYNNR
ncbi:extracellular solute-binding protein [Paenibacillus sp. MWE-103]|uniref:Extracellular solute-binding protein n=1 Tax=Paenibacillus artemisiicola TaxID=1172618 RepID=A0ABS3WF37_9BACL|nr:extracellular solute-binding protein [Paenibacillus artemisiicola]MBO7746725.1 extracellular solute-binding protein [Paenibacillus artemisiicola]